VSQTLNTIYPVKDIANAKALDYSRKVTRSGKISWIFQVVSRR
jgi:hypothetical protein